MRFKKIITSLTAILSLNSCTQQSSDFRQHFKEYGISLTHEDAWLNFIEAQVTGFGRIRTSRDLSWSGGKIYETESGFYLGYFERRIYLINNDGKLLSPGSESIRKINGEIFIGSIKWERPNKIPKSLLDISDDYHRRKLFEEKEDGVYIR